MDRDAFAALFSHSSPKKQQGKSACFQNRGRGNAASSKKKQAITKKRPRSPATAEDSARKSRFIECPLCGTSVYSSLAQQHVDKCVGNSGESEGSQPQAIPAVPLSPETAAPRNMSHDDHDFLADVKGIPLSGLESSRTALWPSASQKGIREEDGRDLPSSEAVEVPHSPPPGKMLRTAGGHRNSPSKTETTSSKTGDSTGDRAAKPGLAGFISAGHHRRPHELGQTDSRTGPDAGQQQQILTFAGPPKLNHENNSTAPAAVKKHAPTASKTAAGHGKDRTDSCQDGVGKGNAFSKLMAASALTSFREEMYLWAHEDGTLSWGWGPVGDPRPGPPAPSTSTNSAHGVAGVKGEVKESRGREWSCQVATKGPAGTKAGMCDVWTNLSSAPPAPEEGQGRGGSGGGRSGSMLVNGIHLGVVGGGDNSGVRALWPAQSLSRLPMPVVKSMLQKNIRRGNAEAAVRCALELAIKSWSDAIRRVLVIIVEDSLIHPCAPLLSWLMVATSKGYRPPSCLVEAFLHVVYETAACPVRGTLTSCRLMRHSESITGSEESQISFDDDEFPAPHPKDLLVFPTKGLTTREWGLKEKQQKQGAVSAGDSVGKGDQGYNGACGPDDVVATSATGDSGADPSAAAAAAAADDAVASIRRALLMRMSYGGLPGDQALLKGACMALGEHCGHYIPENSTGWSDGASADSTAFRLLSRPPPPTLDAPLRVGGIPPFGYAHESVASALKANTWTAFLAEAHAGTGMPAVLRYKVMAHVDIGTGRGGGIAREDREMRAPENREAERSLGAGESSGQARQNKAIASEGGRELSSHAAGIGAAIDCGIGPLMREVDAILSGVDHHCSKVLDDLMRSTSMAAKVGDAIQCAVRAEPGNNGYDEDENASSRVGVRRAAKQAMWACSSSLNARRFRLEFVAESRSRSIVPTGSKATCEASLRSCCSDGFKSVLTERTGLDEIEVLHRDGILSTIDARVWAAMSGDVFKWCEKFVRARLAPGALGK